MTEQLERRLQSFSAAILPGSGTVFLYCPSDLAVLRSFLIAVYCPVDPEPVELVMALRVANRAAFSAQMPILIESVLIEPALVCRNETVTLTVLNKGEQKAFVFGRFVCTEYTGVM